MKKPQNGISFYLDPFSSRVEINLSQNSSFFWGLESQAKVIQSSVWAVSILIPLDSETDLVEFVQKLVTLQSLVWAVFYRKVIFKSTRFANISDDPILINHGWGFFQWNILSQQKTAPHLCCVLQGYLKGSKKHFEKRIFDINTMLFQYSCNKRVEQIGFVYLQLVSFLCWLISRVSSLWGSPFFSSI